MAAGEALRSAALKILQKVNGSDKDVTLATETTGTYDPATESRPPKARATVVEFGQACEVKNLSVAKATALLGDYEAGDREFLLPAASVTEAQLRAAGAIILYGDDVMTIQRVDPHEINFGVVAVWRVVCRLKGGEVAT